MKHKETKETIEEQVLQAAEEERYWISRQLIPHEIYHYTNSDIVKEILSPEGVCFWMTHYEDFEDKLEGKSVQIYCDLALERLHKNGCITEEERLSLADAQIPKQLLFYGDKHCPIGKSVETVAYICCFSKEKESNYMFENYIKASNKKGFCIEFSSGNLFQNQITEGIKNGFRFEASLVLYGEEVIEAFEEFVLGLKDRYGSNADWIRMYGKPLLENRMQEMQFAAKRGKYRGEQEVRLILYKGSSEDDEYETYSEFPSGGKRYVKVVFPKNSLYNIYKSPTVTFEEDKEMRRCICERNYRDVE